MNSQQPLRLHLFGVVRITRAGEELIPALGTSKNTELLAYLALYARNRENAKGRDALAEHFWGDYTRRRNLNMALYSLRNILTNAGVNLDVVIQRTRDVVWFNTTGASCDVIELREKLKRARYIRDPQLAQALLHELESVVPDTFMKEFDDQWVQNVRTEFESGIESATQYLKELLQGQPLIKEELRETPSQRKPLFRFAPVYDPGFFGRDTESAVLCDLLSRQDVRLVTLTGMAGIGKTRLAATVGERMARDFDYNGAFIPFNAINDAARIPVTIARALGIKEVAQQEVDVLEQIVQAVSQERHLLVLDNFELLVESGAPFIGRMIVRIPNVTVLIVSRRTLKLTGEQEFPLQVLPVPEEDVAIEQATENPSIALFRARMRKKRPYFEVNEKNLQTVVAICRRLEGIPLAIELIAGQGRENPARLLGMLEQRFTALAQKRTSRGNRHHSLQAALDISYDALAPDIQQFFDTLSVFEDGCTVEAASAVSGEARADLYLGHLVTCSLLVSDFEGLEPRYRLLETLREFGDQHLELPTRDHLAQAYTDYYLKFASDACQYLQGEKEAEVLDRIEADRSNLFRTIALLVSNYGTYNIDAASLLVQVVGYLCVVRGLLNEGRIVIDRLLDAPNFEASTISPFLFSIFLNIAGVIAERQGDYAQARRRIEQSLMLAEKIGNRGGVANALGNLGLIAWNFGQLNEAHSYFERSLVLDRELNNLRNLIITRMNLANVLRVQGDLIGARQLNTENLDDATAFGDPHGIAWAYGSLGQICRIEKKFEDGYRLCRKSLTQLFELDDKAGVATMLEVISYLHIDQNRFEAGIHLLGAASAVRITVKSPLSPIEKLDFNRYLSVANEALSENGVGAHLWGEGVSTPLDRAVALAIDTSIT